MPEAFAFRRATPDDALCLSVLATQVFLDTYATGGVSVEGQAYENRVLAKPVAAGTG